MTITITAITPSGHRTHSAGDGRISGEDVMRKPRLLDLFSGAGGCAAGYVRAGFDVLGVDNRPQPRYLLSGASEFVQADALEYVAAHGREFDAIHASPPCQRYSSLTRRHTGRATTHSDLVPRVRDILHGYAVPWVVENVPGSPLGFAFMLCGSMFGLGVRRHRYFECSDIVLTTRCQHSDEPVVGVYGNSGGHSRRDSHLPRHSVAEWAVAMGIDWMTGKELSQAIPPAYTEFVGRQLLRALEKM